MQTVFVVFSTLLSGIMCLWWGKKTFLDVTIKTVFAVQAFLGGYLIYTNQLLGN